MYRILNLLLLSLVLFSCEKEDKKPDIKADITFSNVTAKTATVNVHVTGASGLTYILQYKDSTAVNANWTNVTLVNDTATVAGLTPGRIYTFSVKVYSGESLVNSSDASMHTANFTIDGKWFYSLPYSDYNNLDDIVFSIEGATVTIKGKDFYNGMTAKFIQRDNTANVVEMPVTFVDDSTITFKVGNLIPDNPYVGSTFFALKIDDVLFPSNNNVMWGGRGDSTFFKVNNGLYNIDSAQITTSGSCNRIRLYGKFGNSTLVSDYITYFLQMRLLPLSKNVVIRNKNGAQVGFVPIPSPRGSDGCGTAGDIIIADDIRRHPDGVHNYPHITQIAVDMALSPGDYTAQVVADLGNNDIRTTNEFAFTIK